MLLLELPGVWPFTGAAGALSCESQCKQWLYKVSREDTRVGREFHTGGGRLGSLGIVTAGRSCRERQLLHHSTAGKTSPVWDRDDSKGT